MQQPRSGRDNPLAEFSRRHALTSVDLAMLLDIPLETLRRYEREGAPPWIAYALVGLEYAASAAAAGQPVGRGAS